MALLDYEKKEEILLQLKNCEWGAGVFLADLVENNKIFELCGKDTSRAGTPHAHGR